MKCVTDNKVFAIDPPGFAVVAAKFHNFADEHVTLTLTLTQNNSDTSQVVSLQIYDKIINKAVTDD